MCDVDTGGRVAGCIVGEALAQRFQWKVGDRIPLKGSIFPGMWEFNIHGIYRGSRPQDDTTQFWFRWDYLDERRSFQKGFVGWYTVRIAEPDDVRRSRSTCRDRRTHAETRSRRVATAHPEGLRETALRSPGNRRPAERCQFRPVREPPGEMRRTP